MSAASDAEVRARGVRDSLREEKHRLAVQIADGILATERETPAALRREYRDAAIRLALAHRKLIALMSERIAGREKAPASHGTALSLKRNQGNLTTSDQASQGIGRHA